MSKKFIPVIILMMMMLACSKTKKSGNLVVEGTVKGLRLGTLKIKEFKNDSLVNIDSIKVDGHEKFEFHTNIKEPQVMVLELPEVKNGRILFFAAPKDTIHIFAYVESFGINPIVNGGPNQVQKNEFDHIMKQFNNEEMDLFKAKFEAAQQHLLKEADSLGQKLTRLQRKRRLYTLNFIFRNKDKAIAPYTALIEFHNNRKALDTIYKSLTQPVKKSIYAKQIKQIIHQK